MKLLRTIQNVTFAALICSAHLALGQSEAVTQISTEADFKPESTNSKWLKISECLLEVENSVSVPVQETGVLQSLEVKLNQAVTGEQLLGKLDSRDSENEVKLRQMEFDLACEQANDDSDIKYQENLLSLAKEELANFEGIRDSVSEAEINRRNLAEKSAFLAVVRAEKTKDKAGLDAQRMAFSVNAAKLKMQRTLVKAPMDGVISEIFCHPGEWIQAGQPLVKISDLEHLVVHAHVQIDQIERTRLIGSVVHIESTNDQGRMIELEGNVSSYDQQVTGGRLIRLHARVQNVKIDGHWQILPGKKVTLRLLLLENSESLASTEIQRSLP